MNFDPKKTPATLADWLATATDLLSPSAETRVREEIKAHFADAVQDYQATGLAEADATSAALADLGPADAANRRYRWAYLTRTNIATLAGPDRSVRVAMLAWPIFLTIETYPRTYDSAFFCYLIGFIILVYFLLRGAFSMEQPMTARLARQLHFAQFAQLAAVFAELLWLLHQGTAFHSLHYLKLFFLPLLLIMSLWQLNKLRQATDEDFA